MSLSENLIVILIARLFHLCIIMLYFNVQFRHGGCFEFLSAVNDTISNGLFHVWYGKYIYKTQEKLGKEEFSNEYAQGL